MQESTPSRASALGLGCVTFGREIDRAAAFAMMDHAYERGIDFFDTAAAYASGASESIVGEWLASRRPPPGKIVIATKILPPYTPAQIEVAVAQSAQRLGLDAIPVLFVHRWDAALQERLVLAKLASLVVEGRVGRLGASNFSAAQLEGTVDRQEELGGPRFGLVQNIHNYAVQGIDEAVRRICRKHAIAIVTYSPLGAGFLSGKYAAGVQPGTRFAIIPGHQDIYFTDRARARLARLQALAKQSGIAVTQLALGWALRQRQIDRVLVGGRTPEQLDQAIDALALPLEMLPGELWGD